MKRLAEQARVAEAARKQQEQEAEAKRKAEAESKRQRQDYLAAYNAGNYAKTIEILSVLVKQGNADDQNSLGFMYQNGMA